MSPHRYVWRWSRGSFKDRHGRNSPSVRDWRQTIEVQTLEQTLCLGVDRRSEHAERVGDFEDVGQAGVSFSSLDATHVRAIETGIEGEPFLREAMSLADLPHSGSERSVARRARTHSSTLPR